MAGEDKGIARQLSIENLWQRGELGYRLHSGQQKLRTLFYSAQSRKILWDCARQFGKTIAMVGIALEVGLRKKTRIVYAAPTREEANDIVIPTLEWWLEGCPASLRPRRVGSRNLWQFGNGTELHVDGADDDRGNHLRGPGAGLVLADELGFWKHAHYVINSVLLPQTIHTNGHILIASTKPESLGHEWYGFVTEAKQNKSYILQNIYQNPLLTPEQIEEYKREAGGEKSTTWRREFLCEEVTESERAVVPEFDESVHVYEELDQIPVYRDLYVSMDLGLVDYSHVLFAWYDFENACIMVDDEVVTNYSTTAKLAELITSKEAGLWQDKRPKLRVSDSNAQQLEDLAVTHRLAFAPADKYDKEAALNKARQKFVEYKIKIHRRCEQLIHQLKVGVWNTRRTDYERLPGAGHLDGIDALVYLVRHIDYNHNPVPTLLGINKFDHHIAEERMRQRYQMTKLVRRPDNKHLWGRS